MARNPASLPRTDRAREVLRPGADRITRRFAAGVLAGVSLIALAAPAAAVDATWVGGQQPVPFEWTQGTNWQSTPAANVVPDGTAFFINNGAPTSLTIKANASLDQMQFGSGAPAYNFNVANSSIFALTGAGIVNQSASTPIFTVLAGSQMQFLNASSAGTASFANLGTVTFNGSSTAANANFDNSGTIVFAAPQATAGSAHISNQQTGITSFADHNSAGNAVIDNFDSSTTNFLNGSNAGNSHIINHNPNSATVFFDDASAGHATIMNAGQLTFIGSASGANAVITNDGTTTFQNISSAANATITNTANGSLQFTNGATAGSATINNGGGMDFRNASTAGNASITSAKFTRFNDSSTAGAATINTVDGGFTGFFDRSTGGQARFIVAGTGVVDFSATTGTSNNGQLSAGSFEGTGGNIFLGASQLTVGGNNLSTAFAGAINDCTGGSSGCVDFGAQGGSLVKTGTGTLTLSGANTYTGATNVNAGGLIVNGSIAASALTTVNAGGMLGGSGIVGNTFVNGGTLAPGSATTALTVQGNLSFTAASTYMVEVSPTSAARTNVTGTATLGGASVSANFASGAYVSRQYTIVNAVGGVTGSFGTQANTNLPAGFVSSLSYDTNNAFLNLTLNLNPGGGGGGGGGSVNQRNVAGGLSNSFNTAGGIPMIFGGLSAAGLTQASGELATGSQQTTFNAMNLFLGVMTDPFMAGRGEPTTAANGSALSYADSNSGDREAYGMIAKAVPRAPAFAPSWSVWAAGYGGAQTSDGNATLGSHDATSRVLGTVVGADYRFTPQTQAGFALAGGGTSFGVADGLGGGRSDLFQAGAFVRHTEQAAYLTAALAYGWQEIDTDRTLTIAGRDQLHARFNANAFSGRAEAGNRFATPGMGWTPYAAVQFTNFSLPSYAESVGGGASTFALRYDAKDVTDTRSELGLRSDTSFALADAVLTLRGRAAWAHDFNPDRAIAATFQTLPGASFTVHGATQASNTALATASAEMLWLQGFSLGATLEGEFSNATRGFAGKGIARYQW